MSTITTAAITGAIGSGVAQASVAQLVTGVYTQGGLHEDTRRPRELGCTRPARQITGVRDRRPIRLRRRGAARRGQPHPPLEGFLARGTTVTYFGEFELVDTSLRDVHETGNETPCGR